MANMRTFQHGKGASFHDRMVLCPGSEQEPGERIDPASSNPSMYAWCEGCHEYRGVRLRDGLLCRHYVSRKHQEG